MAFQKSGNKSKASAVIGLWLKESDYGKYYSGKDQSGVRYVIRKNQKKAEGVENTPDLLLSIYTDEEVKPVAQVRDQPIRKVAPPSDLEL